MSKRFTVREAEGLLPRLEPLLRQAIRDKADYAGAESAVNGVMQRVMVMGGMVIDRARLLELRVERDQCAARLKEGIESIEVFGCVVKDLDVGVLDFPSVFRNQEVLLCWRLGEPGILFWHSTNEGFAGRKPIDREFLDCHTGDAPN